MSYRFGHKDLDISWDLGSGPIIPEKFPYMGIRNKGILTWPKAGFKPLTVGGKITLFRSGVTMGGPGNTGGRWEPRQNFVGAGEKKAVL